MKKDKKEVEYKEKAGTAWSHSYLNQKPWHPLSYPNQRRKWIAEQTHAQKEERCAEVGREFAQEQDFFRQTAQMSKKEKEKMEVMQAVSFMYMRPPGYNPEAARAAEIADERKRLGLTTTADIKVTSNYGDPSTVVPEKRNPRVKDVFGRTLPTEEEFPSLKNAPRHETGAPTRVKPFAIEIRNVKCARCGAFGHQSGDRECPLKDVLMPSEEARLIREDPLNAILAQTAADELFTWELKQKPGGLSPARGGFKPDDPNQQIIPDEDIYDEYGGFLPSDGDEGTLNLPTLLASLSNEQRKELTDVNAEKKRKHKKHGEVKKKYKCLNSRKFENSGDHNRGRNEQRDDRKSISNEDEQRYQRPRKGEPENREDDDKIHFSRDDGKSDSSGDDEGSHKHMARRGLNFHMSNQNRHGSKGRRTSNKTDDKKGSHRPRIAVKFCCRDDDQRSNRPITKDRFDVSLEYGRATSRKTTYHRGDTRMDSDEEPNRFRHKDRRDSSDDNKQRRLRYKVMRDSSDDGQRSLGCKERRDSSDGEQRRLRYKDMRDSSDDGQRRLGCKERRDSRDGEQRRVRHKDRRDSSDDEQRRLRLKDRRDSSDNGQRRLGCKERRDTSDDEQRRLRLKDRRNSSGNGQRRLGCKERRDSRDGEQRRVRHKDRRDSSDDEQRRLRLKDRRDSSDNGQRRLGCKERRDSSDDEQRRLRLKDRRNSSGNGQRRLGCKERRESSDDEQRRLRCKERRESSGDEQRRLRQKDRRDSGGDEQRRLRYKG